MPGLEQGLRGQHAVWLTRVVHVCEGHEEGLRKVVEVVPADQVVVATDCALASLRQVVTRKKMKALVAGTRIVRAEVTGTAEP